MINLKSNSEFLLQSFTELLEQKNLIQNQLQGSIWHTIQIDDLNDKLCLVINDYKKKYTKPLPFNTIFSDLSKEIMKISFDIDKLIYAPYLREIIFDETKIYLSDIQNKILFNLIVNRDGVNKEQLYKFIWPDDKEISINKLDTHLTNLKNLIFDELKFKINFKSLDKTLKLIIN